MKYKINKESFRARKENNGTYSFMNLETSQIMFLNKTASIIYNNSDIDNIDDLIKFIMREYDCPNYEIVKLDCEQIIYYMGCLGLIKIFENTKQNLNGITIAGESDFDNISRYIEEIANDSDLYLLLNSNKKIDFTSYAIRTRQFNNIEHNFIYKDDKGKIKALLTLGYNKGSNVFTLQNLIVKKRDKLIINEMFSYIFKITHGLNKIRFFLEETKETPFIADLIKSSNFEIEAVFKKEYGDHDLLIYCKTSA